MVIKNIIWLSFNVAKGNGVTIFFVMFCENTAKHI